jgi:outer membrane protein OmpA-like peptidoglycan-associated protein
MSFQSRFSLAVPVATVVALGFALGAPGAWAQPNLTEQQIHDRLLGKAAPTATATPAAPVDPACATADAIASNPACGHEVTANRPWSLTGGHAMAAPAAVAKATPPSPVHKASVSRAMPASRHRASASKEAVACDMNQAGDALGLNLCLTFGKNSSALTDVSRKNLDQLAAVLNQADLQNRKVRIDGYADASGNAQKNVLLSESRARSAVAYLEAHGVAANRLAAAGFGGTHPIPGHDPVDPLNRRVEARLDN